MLVPLSTWDIQTEVQYLDWNYLRYVALFGLDQYKSKVQIYQYIFDEFEQIDFFLEISFLYLTFKTFIIDFCNKCGNSNGLNFPKYVQLQQITCRQ